MKLKLFKLNKFKLKNPIHINLRGLKSTNKNLALKKNPRVFLWVGIVLITIFGSIIGIQQLLKKDSKAAWWNGDYKYRTAYSFTATNAVASERKVKIDVDTQTLISAGKVQSDCDDIRFTAADGKVLDYFIDTNTQDCNTNSTDFYIKVPSVAVGGNLIYMYYGNSSIARSDLGGRKNDFFDETGTSTALKGYWKMNETSANTCTGGTNDSCDSALTNDGAWNGNATTTTTAKLGGRAVTFDGNTDYIQVSDNASLNPTSSLTISFWVNPANSTTNTLYLLAKGDASNAANRAYEIRMSGTTGRPQLVISDGSSASVELTANAALVDNVWTHLVFTWNPTTTNIYINGQLDNTGSSTKAAINNDNQALRIGTDISNTTTRNLQGYIDDVRIYGSVITATQATTLYNSGNGQEINSPVTFTPSSGPTAASEETTPGPIAHWKFDEGQGQTIYDSTKHSLNGVRGVDSSATSTDPTLKQESDCVIGKCLYFDGGDVLEFGDILDFNSSFTIGGWIKTRTNNTRIAAKGGTPNAQYRYYVDNNSTTCRTYDGTNIVLSVENTVTVTDNKWHHVACTLTVSGSNGTLRIYIDGRLIGTSSTGSIASWNTNGSESFRVGAGGTGGTVNNGFVGLMDEFKVYPYARSLAEIKADYSSGASVLGLSDQKDYLSDGLVGYWKMDQTSGNATDSSGNGLTLTANGSPTYATGKFGNAASFDGSSSFDYSGTISGVKTISFWTNYPSGGGLKALISKTASTDAFINGATVQTGGTNVYWNAVPKANTTSPTSPGTWGMITITDTSGVDLTAFRVGYSSAIPAFATNGTLIDEVRLYNRELSPDEVRNLYNWAPGPVGYWNLDEASANTCVGGANDSCDTSGNGNDGAWNGDVTKTTGKFGNGVTLDGTGDYISMGTSAGENHKTISVGAWIKTTSTGTGLTANTIVDKSRGSSAGSAYLFTVGGAVSANAGKLEFGMFNGSTWATSYSTSTVNDGNWHYVAATYDKSNIRLYIDGKLDQTTSSTVDISYQTQAFAVGRYVSGDYAYFNGVIDDVKIYNYARTSGQIVEDMNASHPLGGSPVGSQTMYWKLDEQQGTTAQDTTGNNFDGTVSGATWKTKKDCKINGCIDIDTNTDNISAGDVSFLDNTTATTITFWMNSALSSTGEVIGKWSTSDTSNTFQVRTFNTDELVMYVASSLTDAGNNFYLTSNLNIPTSTWTHITIVYNGTEANANRIKIYKNGNLASGAVTNTIPTSLTASSANLKLGDLDYSAVSAQVAKYDEIKIYSATLTTDQIRADMNAGSSVSYSVLGSSEAASLADGEGNPPIYETTFDTKTGQTVYDISGSSNNGTRGADGSSGSDDPTWELVTSPTKNANGLADGTLRFDGTDDYVSIPNNAALNIGSSDFTLEAWVKGRSMANSDIIYGKSNGGGASTSYGYLFGVFDSIYPTLYFATSATAHTKIQGTTALSNNQWYHIAVVVDRDSTTNTKVYLNGSPITTTVDNLGTNTGSITNTVAMAIGSESDTGFNWDGWIDNAKIYNYARSAGQVAYDFNRGSPVGHWKMDECQGSTIFDSSGNNNSGTIIIGGTGTQTSAGTCTTSSTAWGNGITGKFGSVVTLDGTDDYISVADSNSLKPKYITFAAWVKFDVALSSQPATFPVAIDKYNTTSGYGLLFRTNGDLNCRFGDGITIRQAQLFAMSDELGTSWHHIACTHDGTSGKIYIDGKLRRTTAIPEIVHNTDTLYIGSFDALTSLQGKIDDVRIYNYALSTAQIKKTMNEGSAVRFGQ